MKRFFRRISLFIIALFVAPSLIHLAIWAASERPSSWRDADWSSAGILPAAAASQSAAVYVMAARTGGLKGAISKHSWIVMKKPHAQRYDRYDVVGWGKPVRHNAYPADGRWYSNRPEFVFAANGREAARLIPEIENAIRHYRWRARGDYTLWPGPNSNTFVASIIRAVPGFDALLPPTAIGKDFPSTGRMIDYDAARQTLRLTLAGYAGVTLGLRKGFEINLLGLVAGIGWREPTIELPGFGSLARYFKPAP